MWIDLNVPYYGTSESNHYDLTGCRQMLPAALEQVLSDVTSRRCATCHQNPHGIPRDAYVRVSNIENNSFLLAPLARSAGGTERCGVPIFASREDPDYRAIVDTFLSVTQLLRQSPRMDMVETADCPTSRCAPGAE